MATYRNPELRERLAAEYVLGTLAGRARARFQSLMRYDPELRRAVADWETRLTPLAHAGTEIAPPDRLWRAIDRRVKRVRRRSGWWESLAFWRTFAVTGVAFAAVLGVAIGMAPRPEPPISTVAVMSDSGGRPAMVVAWPPMKAMRDPHIRVKIVQDHPTMAPSTSWELWLLPGAKAAPISLGQVSLDQVQVIKLPQAVTARMAGAWGMALSVEPAGGSPTGAPTGPIIFRGECVRIL
jgi:anti-sigma-K factor RskA